MGSRASQVEALVICAGAEDAQTLLEKSMRDGQVSKGRPGKLFLGGEALSQLLLCILDVDKGPEPVPDVPSFAGLLEEEFQAFRQHLRADLLKGPLEVFGHPSRQDDILLSYGQVLENI